MNLITLSFLLVETINFFLVFLCLMCQCPDVGSLLAFCQPLQLTCIPMSFY